MNIIKLWLLSCCVVLWTIITNFDVGYWYFEYRYYCTIQSNISITISIKPEQDSTQKCLSYVQVLDQNIKYYSKQIKIAQDNINQWQFTDYRESYIEDTQVKLLQSRFLHKQLIKSMNKFEIDLFQKTMMYINYRLKSTNKNLQSSVDYYEAQMVSTIEAWESGSLQNIIQDYNSKKVKLDIINRILKSTNFNELMPLYTLYQQWKFD